MALSAVALLFAQVASEPVLEEAAEPRPDIVIPLAHAVALMTVMRATESFIWPDPFARTQHFAGHYEEAFTRPPHCAFEGNGVRPSALDLVFTPLGGMLLGEARYVGWNAAQGIRAPALRGTVRAVLDPLGELERAVGTGC
jgi:hypothetical protein